MKYESLAVHGGSEEKSSVKGVSFPVHMSSTFIQDSIGEYGEFVYSRSNNPTRNNVEVLAAQLENAKHGLAMSSGMAATALAFALLRPGDKVLINSNIYGGTWSYVSQVFAEQNIEYEIVPDFNTYNFNNADKNVRMIFIETPSNPLLDVTDLPLVCKRAKEKDLLVVVDNTFMTSYLQKPLDHGADIVVYSATKYYAGHSDLIAGLVILNDDALYAKLKFYQKTFGAILSPSDSFLLARGIKTLPLRMDCQQRNAMAVATFFDQHPSADKVYYCGLPTHKGYDIQRRQASGDGAVLSVLLNDAYDINRFCKALRIFDLAVSLGGVESLICHPYSMTHDSFPADLKKEIGIEENLLRIAVGIENTQDILEDIQQALECAKN